MKNFSWVKNQIFTISIWKDVLAKFIIFFFAYLSIHVSTNDCVWECQEREDRKLSYPIIIGTGGAVTGDN